MHKLQSLRIDKRVHERGDNSGIDCIEECLNKEHFLAYPYVVSYKYNSKGFRDQEWPADLQNAIWCIGDSFTVGMGTPFENTWPQVLSSTTGCRTINISMDGASNAWISRWAKTIAEEVSPKNIVIMWSYFHRRELNDTTLSDEQRRVWNQQTSDLEDLENFINCAQAVKPINAVQFTIPDAQSCSDLKLIWDNIRGPSWPIIAPTSVEEYYQLLPPILYEICENFKLEQDILKLLTKNDIFNNYKTDNHILEVPKLDLARDGHHFDVATSRWVVEKIIPCLK